MSLNKSTAGDAESGFEDQIRLVVGRLQSAIKMLIETTPGITRRPTDLRQTLSINPKLAWQVHRIAHAEDPCVEVAHLPRAVAMQRFLDAALRRGAPAKRIDAVRDRYAEYETMAKRHAGGRAGFESLLSNISEQGSEHVALNHRRAAFKAQSHMLGVHADAQLSCQIFSPSSDDESMLDAVGVRGLIGLQRLRRDVGWPISRMRATDQDGTLRKYAGPEPLAEDDDDASRYGLLREFSSKPLPNIQLRHDSDGWASVELRPNGLGVQSATTCIIGHVFPGVFKRFRDERNAYQESHTLVRTPCKILVQDTLLHKDLVPATQPHVLVLSDHRGVDPSAHGRECDELTLQATITHLGNKVDTSLVPGYEKLVSYALRRMGWNRKDFEAFRCCIEYPPMPSSVMARFDLSEPEQGA